MATEKAEKTYRGGTLRDLLRSYGNDRMRTDRKYKRDVIKALKKRNNGKRPRRRGPAVKPQAVSA